MSTTSEVLNAAMTLNLEQRSEVAHHLLLSLEQDVCDADVDLAWAEEVRRRRQAIRDGRATLRNWSEALASIRESIIPKGAA